MEGTVRVTNGRSDIETVRGREEGQEGKGDTQWVCVDQGRGVLGTPWQFFQQRQRQPTKDDDQQPQAANESSRM